MALDETTRQVNKRVVEVLEEAESRIGQAETLLTRTTDLLRGLSRYTNAHDVAAEQVLEATRRVGEVHDDVIRRFNAESEGE